MTSSIKRESRAAEPVLADWVSREDLAAELGLKVDTLRRWDLKRIGPAFTKAGRRVLYSREAVNAWLKSRTVNPPQGGK